MKKLFTVLCLLVTSLIFSQDAASGYYITTNGEKITGEYEYGDFSLPQNLKFRAGSGEFSNLDAKSVQEIYITGSYKFVKYTVNIDVNNPVGAKLSNSYKPDFQTKELFLNVLAEGEATLYSYNDGYNIKYFVKTPALPVPQQLVYRTYLQNGKIAENNEYKAQLSKLLICESIKSEGIADANYNQYALIKFVKTFNTCKGSTTTLYDNKAGKKIKLFFGAYAGLSAYSFEITGNGVPPLNKDTGLSFCLGSELEMMFASNKFSLFLRAEAEWLDSEVEGTYAPDDVTGSHQVYVYKTKSAMLSAFLGPRYYFDISDNSRIFIDMSACYTMGTGNLDLYNYVVSSTTVYERAFIDGYSLGSALSFNAGIGYSFNNSFAVELRANTNRDVIGGGPPDAKMRYAMAGVN